MGDIAVNIDTDVINVTIGDDPVINVTLTMIDGSTGSPFTQKFTGDDVTVTFIFDAKFKSGSLLVFLSEIFQSKDTKYEEAADGLSITFVTAPKKDRIVEVIGAYD